MVGAVLGIRYELELERPSSRKDLRQNGLSQNAYGWCCAVMIMVMITMMRMTSGYGGMIDGAGRSVRGTVTMFVIGVPDYDRDPDDNDDEDGDDDDDAGDCGNGVGYCGI